MSAKLGVLRIFNVLLVISIVLFIVLLFSLLLFFIWLVYLTSVKNNGIFDWSLLLLIVPYLPYILTAVFTLIITSSLAYITLGFLK
jgi:hypothetical protein